MTYAPLYLAATGVLVLGLAAGVQVAMSLMQAERKGGRS